MNDVVSVTYPAARKAEPIVHVVVNLHRDIPDTAFHPARMLFQHLQDSDTWQHARCLSLYADWSRTIYMEEGIVAADLKIVNPQQVRDYDVAVAKINMRINRGVASQAQADAIIRELRAFLKIEE